MKKIILIAFLVLAGLFLFGCTQNEVKVDFNTLSTPPAGIEGNVNAPVTVVEYSDYQCPFCRKWVVESKKQLFDEYVSTGKVKFIFKDFPLNGHPMAMIYATALRCAGEQGKYFAMHDAVYGEQDKLAGGAFTLVENVTLADISNWAKGVGANQQAFNACLEAGNYDANIIANAQEGAAAGVKGTPSFIIGKTGGTGTLIVGAVPYSTIKSKIDEALK